MDQTLAMSLGMPEISIRSKAVLTVIVAFAFLAPAVAADKQRGWQFMGETESGIVQYIDMSQLKKERGHVRVRTLVDYKKKPAMSLNGELTIWSETDTEYIDCKRKRFASLEIATYECRMAKCSPNESFRYPLEDLKFYPVSSHSSLGRNIFTLVCQK